MVGLWGYLALLLLLATPDYTLAEEDLGARGSVEVFDFLPVNRKAKVRMQYGLGALTVPFTLCLWLRPGYKATSGRLLTAWDSNTSVIINSIAGRVLAAVNQSGLAPFNTPQLDAHAWYHLCLALTHTTPHLYLNNATFEMDPAGAWPYELDHGDADQVTVELGSDENAFSGQMAEFKLFKRELSAGQATRLSLCDSGSLDSLVSLSVSVMAGVQREMEPVAHMCQPRAPEFLALFQIRGNQSRSRDFCRSVEGRLISRSDEMSVVIHEMLESRDVDSDARMAWTGEASKEGLGEVIYTVRRSRGDFHQVLTKEASIKLPMIACIIPVGKRISMKVWEVKEFYLYTRRGKLILQSDDGDVILKSRCHNVSRTCMVYLRLGDPVAESVIEEGHIILGRRVWRKYQEEEEEYQATLSTCGEGEFTCDDSQCVELSSRCDGRPKCQDGSDEGGDCCRMEEPPSYRQKECPVPEPMVTLHVHFHGVNSIALERNEFTATLSVIISWLDRRLTFTNLNNFTREMQPSDFSKIWIPQVKFENAKYDDNLRMKTKEGVLEEYTVSAQTPGRPDVRNSYEVLSYSGSEVRNTQRIQYLFTFSCEYDLFAFPFDTQECDIELHLPHSPGCQPQWNAGTRGIHTMGTESTIAMYDISRIRYFYNTSSPSNSAITFKLLFYRRFEAYLLTTFGPCIILYLLSELTLTHFRLNDFTDRITVTLSLLIVIASIFSQVSSTLPSSPAPKFVDWFFFYCILRVSFVFSLHSIIDKKLRSQQEGTSCKVAWDAKPRLCNWRSRLNVAAVVNHGGVAILSITDVAVLCLFITWVIMDKNDKTDRFNGLNVTQIISNT